MIWHTTQGAPLPTGLYSAVATRPYDNTTYGPVVEYRKSGWSNYNGIQLELERRYSHGLAFQIMYIMSNALRAGDQEGNSGATSVVPELNQYLPGTVPEDYDARNRFLNYRRDISVPKHRVRWNWIADQPFGWRRRDSEYVKPGESAARVAAFRPVLLVDAFCEV